MTARRTGRGRSAALIAAGFGACICLGAALAQSVGERHVISQKNREFAPGRIAVAPGDVVVFQNDDKTDHHIMARSGPTDFSSRLLPRGASYEVEIAEEGTWEIGCRIHPRMQLMIRSRAPSS